METTIRGRANEKGLLKPLNELYAQYIRDPDWRLNKVRERFINIAYPHLGWGTPPEFISGYARFRNKDGNLDLTRKATIESVFQLCLQACLEQKILDIQVEL